MKSFLLFVLALFMAFCLGTDIQAKKHQRYKKHFVNSVLLKRTLGVCVGLCVSPMLLRVSESDLSYFSAPIDYTLGALNKKLESISENLAFSSYVCLMYPVVVLCGYASYKLITSCNCLKEEETEETTE